MTTRHCIEYQARDNRYAQEIQKTRDYEDILTREDDEAASLEKWQEAMVSEIVAAHSGRVRIWLVTRTELDCGLAHHYAEGSKEVWSENRPN